MYFIFVIILLMFVFDVVWWRLTDRRLRVLPRHRIARTLLSIFALAQVIGLGWILFSRIFSHRPGEFLPQSIVAAIYLWHFVILPVTVLMYGGAGLIGSIAGLFRQFIVRPESISPSVPAQSESVTDPIFLSRRQMLSVAVVAVPPIVCGIGTARAMSNVGEFRINRVTIPLRSLPASLDGFTISHVSDTHIGSFTNAKMLDAIVDQTNRLKSDIVLFTGDLINHSLADLPAGIAMVKRMRADLGVYLCEGNHDLLQDREGFERQVLDANLNLLINESSVVSAGKQELQLLGLRWGGRLPFATRMTDPHNLVVAGPVQSVVPKLRPGAFPILLAHHPHAFDTAAEAGIPLTLAGHTHGGQLMVGRNVGFGPMMFRYWSGLYRQPISSGNDAALFVSNGVGNWFPLRINAPAEIVQITLTRA